MSWIDRKFHRDLLGCGVVKSVSNRKV